jgi:hypothetical protein
MLPTDERPRHSPHAFLYSAVSGLEAAAAWLFEGSKRAEELQHQLVFEALAARHGGFRDDVASEVRQQVLAAIGAGIDLPTARAAFDAVLEPVLIEVLRSLTESHYYTEHHGVISRIVEEELHHSGGPCESDAVYQAAIAGAVKTLTCPFFSRPLSVILGAGTSALGFRIREIFRRARTVRGVDPARVFGLCPMLRGDAQPLAMSAWARQRVRGDFLSPMLQTLRVYLNPDQQPSARAIEAAVVKAAAELVREARFNVVRSGVELYRLTDPAVTVRRMSDGVDLVNVPLPTHGAHELTVDGFVRRIARRERVLRKTRAGWWDPSTADHLPTAELNAMPVVSGVVASVSSLAHLPGNVEWSGFATPEATEGATYNVLITGNRPGSFVLSLACDHCSVDGHVMGEFGLALAERAGGLLGCAPPRIVEG